MNGKGLFVVRAVVTNPDDRPSFDKWYETEHLPDALKTFGALRAWRTWSRSDASVHIAFYEFPTLAGLRIDDGVEPEAAIVWGPASAIAAVPRPLTWLVGLTSRAWPRRATEDPLLPDHIVSSARLDPLPIHHADRRDFRTIRNMTDRELVCSRARRDSEGRLNGVSPLFPDDTAEVYLAQSREPEHASSASDRLLARPEEFGLLPQARSALQTWIDWHTERITAHDGLV